jgi:radical SAM protein with 4Fe4S-binding SPASM domain
MKFKLDQYNYKSLSQLAEMGKKERVKKIEIELTESQDDLPYFSEIMPYLYSVLDQEMHFQVWLKGFPFCVVSKDAIDHILSRDKNSEGIRPNKCQTCRWFERCSGFPTGYFAKFDSQEVCPQPDLPDEVMIEAEPRCNFKCRFCFNQISFAKAGREIKGFSANYLKEIIDNIFQVGIKIVRFTGGEPMLRKDIFQLLEYAKNKGLETRLNTNASLINQKTARRLKGIVDNVLIPIEDCRAEKEAKITGSADALPNKIRAIELLKSEDIPVVRAGTVAIRENIINFEKIAQLIEKLPLDEWELYRPIPVNKKEQLDSSLIANLVEKLLDLRKRTGKVIFMSNALPFCAINDPNKINSVCRGILQEGGYSRLVIDPRGFVKPDYCLDENIGEPLDILSAWQHSFVKKMRNLEYLPKECQNCPFSFKCRGGSRPAAKMVFGSFQALDPLSQPKNIYG